MALARNLRPLDGRMDRWMETHEGARASFEPREADVQTLERPGQRSFSELREQLRCHRGAEVAIFTRAGESAVGHLYSTLANGVVVVEDPANMMGIHVIPLDQIDRIAWGSVPASFFLEEQDLARRLPRPRRPGASSP